MTTPTKRKQDIARRIAERIDFATCPQEGSYPGIEQIVEIIIEESAAPLTVEQIIEEMDKLKDGERHQIINHYCRCGSKDVHCQCSNDE